MRLLQSASAFESLRDSEKLEVVGLAYMLLWPENVEEVDEGRGVM